MATSNQDNLFKAIETIVGQKIVEQRVVSSLIGIVSEQPKGFKARVKMPSGDFITATVPEFLHTWIQKYDIVILMDMNNDGETYTVMGKTGHVDYEHQHLVFGDDKNNTSGVDGIFDEDGNQLDDGRGGIIDGDVDSKPGDSIPDKDKDIEEGEGGLTEQELELLRESIRQLAKEIEEVKSREPEKGEPFRYEDFTSEQLAQLKGERGEKGAKGDKGDPFVFDDFTSIQLASLKGSKGDRGASGARGERGQKGEDGESPTIDLQSNSDGTHTITINNVDGTSKSATIKDGKNGEPIVGLDGFSPTVEMKTLSNGNLEISITDKDGTTKGIVPKGDRGQRGEKGEAFKFEDFTPEQLKQLKGDRGESGSSFTFNDLSSEQLEKIKGEKGDLAPMIYIEGQDFSKAKPNYDYYLSPDGWFGVITSVTNNGQGVNFHRNYNLKGAKGDRSERGLQGVKGEDGTSLSFDVIGLSGAPTPTRRITITDSKGKSESFEISNGERGATGATGARGATGLRGEKGETGAKGADGRSVTFSTTPTTDGNRITLTGASGTTSFIVRDGKDASESLSSTGLIHRGSTPPKNNYQLWVRPK